MTGTFHFTTAGGESVAVQLTIKPEAVAKALAQRAIGNGRTSATALGGAVAVTIERNPK